MTVVTVNGNTYSDDGSTPKDMNDGGSADWFFPLVQDTMVEISDAVDATAASEAAASLAAISAVAAPGTNATSTSTVILNTGSKTCTIQTGKAFVIGSFVVWADTTAPSARWMFGQITAYNSGTGSFTCAITRFQGSGPVSTWTISLAAPGSRDTGGAHSDVGSFTLFTTTEKFRESTGYVALRSATLAAGGSSIPGPNAFAIRNSASNYATDLQVLDSVGGGGSTINGFLPSGRTARIDAPSTTSWLTSDLLSYGSDAKQQITFSSIVAGTGGVWTKAIALPSGNTVVLVYGASLHAVVFDSSGNFSAPLLIRAGLSTIGGEATVTAVAVNDITDNVLVASCPDGGTALQTVILTVSSLSLGLGTMVATTLGTAAVRLVDLRPINSSAVGNRSFILSALGSTTTMQNYGIVIVSAATTMTVGAVRTDTTTASFAAVVVLPNAVSDVYISLTSTATVLSAKAVTVNPTTGAQTLGSTATTTVTSASGILVRENLQNYGDATVVFLNTLPKGAKLTLAGTVPAFGSPVSLTSAITTANTYAISVWNALPGTAVSGTDSSGRFITEMTDWDYSTFASIRTATVAMSAAHTVVWVGRSAYPLNVWQLLSSTELVVANCQTAEGFPTTQRLNGLATFAQVLLAPEANYPRFARPRTTLFSGDHVLSVTDGTKPSVQYTLSTVSGEATRAPVSFLNSLAFGHLGWDNADQPIGFGSGLGFGISWVAAGPAPSLSLSLQRARLV